MPRTEQDCLNPASPGRNGYWSARSVRTGGPRARVHGDTCAITGAMASREDIDRTFTRLVLIRDNWTCQRCWQPAGRAVGNDLLDGLFPGYDPQETRQRGLVRTDLMGAMRGSHLALAWALAWLPLNAASHCPDCHWHLTSNPEAMRQWIKAYLTEPFADSLYRIARIPVTLSGADIASIGRHYREELRRLEREGGTFAPAPVLVSAIAEARALHGRVLAAGSVA